MECLFPSWRRRKNMLQQFEKIAGEVEDLTTKVNQFHGSQKSEWTLSEINKIHKSYNEIVNAIKLLSAKYQPQLKRNMDELKERLPKQDQLVSAPVEMSIENENQNNRNGRQSSRSGKKKTKSQNSSPHRATNLDSNVNIAVSRDSSPNPNSLSQFYNVEMQEQKRGSLSKSSQTNSNTLGQGQESGSYYSFNASVSSSNQNLVKPNISSGKIGSFSLSLLHSEPYAKDRHNRSYPIAHNHKDTTRIATSTPGGSSRYINKLEENRNKKFNDLEKELELLKKDLKEAEISKNQQQLTNLGIKVDALKRELQIRSYENDLVSNEKHLIIENDLIQTKINISGIKREIELTEAYNKSFHEIETFLATIRQNGIHCQNYQTAKQQSSGFKRKLQSMEFINEEIKVKQAQITDAIINLEIDCISAEIEARLNQLESDYNRYSSYVSKFLGTTDSEVYKICKRNFFQLNDNLNEVQAPNQQLQDRKDSIRCSLEESLKELDRKAAENEHNKNIQTTHVQLINIKMKIATIKRTVNSQNYQDEKEKLFKLKLELGLIEELTDDIQRRKKQIAGNVDVLENEISSIEAEDGLNKIEAKYIHFKEAKYQHFDPENIDSWKKCEKYLIKLKEEINQIQNLNQQLSDKKNNILFDIERSFQHLSEKVAENDHNRKREIICNDLKVLKTNLQTIRNKVDKYNFQSEKQKFLQYETEFHSIEKLKEGIQLTAELKATIQDLKRVFTVIEADANLDQIDEKHKQFRKSFHKHTAAVNNQYCIELREELEKIIEDSPQINEKKKRILGEVSCSLVEIDHKAAENEYNRKKQSILKELKSLEESIEAICNNFNNHSYLFVKQKLKQLDINLTSVEGFSEEIKMKKEEIADNIYKLKNVFIIFDAVELEHDKLRRSLDEPTTTPIYDEQRLINLKDQLGQLEPINETIDEKKIILLNDIKCSLKELNRRASENNYRRMSQIDEGNGQENREESTSLHREKTNEECDVLDSIQTKFKILKNCVSVAKDNNNLEEIQSIATSIEFLLKDLKAVYVKNLTIKFKKANLEKCIKEAYEDVCILERKLRKERKQMKKLSGIEENIANIKRLLNYQNFEDMVLEYGECFNKLNSIEPLTNNVALKKHEVGDAIRYLRRDFEAIKALYRLNDLESCSRIDWSQFSETTSSDFYNHNKQKLNYLKNEVQKVPDINQVIFEKKVFVSSSIDNALLMLDQKAWENENNRTRYTQNYNQTRDGQIEVAAEATEDQSLEILDVHQYFRDDFDFNTLEGKDKVEQIRTIGSWAKRFEDSVNNFNEAKYSLEYFVLDEKLMRFIEHLDKIKCKDEPEALQEKVKVIQEIKSLHGILDERAFEE